MAAVVVACSTMGTSAAHASVALVQSNSATGTTATVTATWASAVTAGHLLVATVSVNGAGGGGAPTISAPAGWTSIVTAANAGKVTVAMYYIQNCAAKTLGSTEAFTTTNSSATTVRLLEFSGIVTTGALDVSGTATGAAATTSSVSSTGTVSTSPELGVAIFAHQIPGAANTEVTASSPYADLGAGNLLAGAGSTGVHEDTLYNAAVTGGDVATASVAVSASSHSWAMAVATFQQAPLYWRGGLTGCASGSSFSSPSCWSTTSGGASASLAPGTADRTNFDANGTGNCALDSTTAGSITTTAGYTGTITQGAQDVALRNDITIGGGTFLGRAGQTIATNQSGAYNGGIVVSGGAFNGNGATLAVKGLYVSGGTFTAGTGNFSTNNGGTTILSGGTSTFGAGTVAFAGLVTLSGGTVTFGSGAPTFAAGLDVEGANVTFGASASTVAVTGTATVGAGTVTFTNGAAATDFSNTLLFTQSGGTINVNGATVAVGSTITTGSNDAFVMSGGTFNNTTSGGVLAVGTAGGGGGIMNQSGATAVYNGVAAATETFNGPLKVSGSMTLGTATMAGTGVATRKDVTINAGGTLSLSSAGFAFSGPTAMTIAGTLNAGSGTVTFPGPPSLTVSGTYNAQSSSLTLTIPATISGTYNAGTSTTKLNSTVALSGTFNTNSSTAVTFGGVVTMSGTSAFNGNTGVSTFSVAPTLTAGTFTVGDAGSTGSVIFTLGATFTSGMTLAFPANGSTLSVPGGQTLALNGTVTSSGGRVATPPKIARSSGATGITVAFGATSVLNVNGLEIDNSVAAGVTIADGALFNSLQNVAFKSNVAASVSTGATHLAITSSNPAGAKVIVAPGCSFDASAQYNVTLSGVSGSTGVRAIFEFQSTALNGARGGAAYDLDADTNGDNVADSTGPNRYGAVVEWVKASPIDTAGTAVGFPTAAFDWNTFQWYGVYVAYRDAGGAGTSDMLWLRNNDGSPAYSFTVPQTSGDLVGTPAWDSVNEVTANLDVNGNGNKTDTDVRVVYLATSTGRIIKLVDNGSSLARPASGPWASDFTNNGVSTITSGLANDGTNLYFGGTGGGTANVFGVQVAGGANEATLTKTVGPLLNTLTTVPSSTTSGGSTYLFVGSTVLSGNASIYRINMRTAMVDTSYGGSTTSINGAVVLVNGRAYAASDGGAVYALDALNFASGGFTNITGFPYQTAAAKPIQRAPWVDSTDNTAYFGDDGGNVYALTSAGAVRTGYPLPISGAPKVTSTPIYVSGSGVLAVGANDGYLYFIDRNNGSGPSLFKRFFVTSAGHDVSSVSYNANTLVYMVSSSDGRLTFVSAADVADPTPGAI
jgi:hypothetical protein